MTVTYLPPYNTPSKNQNQLLKFKAINPGVLSRGVKLNTEVHYKPG